MYFMFHHSREDTLDLGDVDLATRQIYLYDSLRSLNKADKLNEHVTCSTMLMPHILNSVKYYGRLVIQREIWVGRLKY